MHLPMYVITIFFTNNPPRSSMKKHSIASTDHYELFVFLVYVPVCLCCIAKSLPVCSVQAQLSTSLASTLLRAWCPGQHRHSNGTQLHTTFYFSSLSFHCFVFMLLKRSINDLTICTLGEGVCSVMCSPSSVEY